MWESSFLRGRNYSSLLNDLKQDDCGLFSNFSRMSHENFVLILSKIEGKISKKDTNFRASVPAAVRLAITLRFLATGDSYGSLMYLFRVSKPAISLLVPEVCKAIVEALLEYVKMPENEEQWLSVTKDFEEKWNFPRAVGAIDGKHVAIQCPPKTGSEYFNYKSFFSFVLFALVDADYNFMFVDVGCQRRISDGGVFKNCQLYDNIQNGTLNLPPPSPLPNSSIPVPFVILGDEAFALSDSLMKPYSGYHKKGSPERVYNYRLSRARRVVENAFGVLASVFRVFKKPLELETENAKWAVMACVYLHNFLRRSATSSRLYCPTGTLDTEENGEVKPGTWRSEETPTSLLNLKNVPRRPSTTAKHIKLQHTS